ncbi:hypothetical protein AURDEDRAFT_163453 [Auricularia subglabra TFB-10046 SS5]|nr:hypothetical protein AURDEDRAFT_163453 [Auricularia subglabra TFB-10046 SS5]
MAPPTQRRCTAESLPPELLDMIFAPLPHRTLLLAAAVCSWWRAGAIQQPMYYRSCAFVFPESFACAIKRSPHCADVRRLERIIAEAEAKDYNVGLEVYIELKRLEANEGRVTMESGKSLLRETILPALCGAVSRCVALYLSVDYASAPILLEGLVSPAPCLRSLAVTVGIYESLVEESNCDPLPGRFLSANAPRLTDVYIFQGYISMESPCFPSVLNLRLYCPEQAPRMIEVGACFPHVKHVALERLPFNYEVLPEDYSSLQGLETLYLGSIGLMDDEYPLAKLVSALNATTPVPFIESHSEVIKAFVTLIPTSGALSLHLFECLLSDDADYNDFDQFTRLRLEFTSGTLTRSFSADVPFSCTWTLLDLASRSVDLVTDRTIDDRHLRTFMENHECMPCLETLRITLITWTTLAPGATLTANEEVLYAVHPIRGDCSCLGGMFSDEIDERCPTGDARIEWRFLKTIELRASRRESTVSRDILRGLAQSFDRGRRLILSNGLSLAQDARDPDVAALYSAITSPDRRFCASLDFVVRAAEVLDFAAIAKKAVWKEIDEALNTDGPDFHWDHCTEAAASASPDSDDASLENEP